MDEQRQQFMTVIQELQKKVEPLMKEAQSGGNPQEIGPKIMKIRREHEGRIEAILTDPQKKQWKKMLGKPFDLMVYPNRSHSISEDSGTSLHVYALIARYIVEHLPAGPR